MNFDQSLLLELDSGGNTKCFEPKTKLVRAILNKLSILKSIKIILDDE